MTVGQLSVGQKFFDQKRGAKQALAHLKGDKKVWKTGEHYLLNVSVAVTTNFYHPCNLHFTIIGERPFGQIVLYPTHKIYFFIQRKVSFLKWFLERRENIRYSHCRLQ